MHNTKSRANNVGLLIQLQKRLGTKDSLTQDYGSDAT